MLDEISEKGIIAQVTEATEWCAPLVVIQKPKGGLRLCVDLTRLNKHVRRPTHPLRTPRDSSSSSRNPPRGQILHFTGRD